MPDWAKWPTLKIDEHGGVSESSSEMSKNGGSDGKNPLYCSFCGKSQHEVRKLIAGPTVFICDECVELCLDIIGEENNDRMSARRQVVQCSSNRHPQWSRSAPSLHDREGFRAGYPPRVWRGRPPHRLGEPFRKNVL